MFGALPAVAGADRALGSLEDARRLSAQGDVLVKSGREPEAVRAYLAAHRILQGLLLEAFQEGLRGALGGRPADEAALQARGEALASLRNVNLSKLWVVLDPDDRAFLKGLEAERAALLGRFDEFAGPVTAEPLEAFLARLYPEDRDGERQMAALREGRVPPSRRWARLGLQPRTD